MCTRALCHSLEGKGEGHSVTLWKAKIKGTLIVQCIIDDDNCMYRFVFCRYVLRDKEEECLAMPLTHDKASGQ